MNAFALSKQSKEMQGSAWCIKQHKVFRVFIRTGIPNRIPLELWKRSRFSEGKRKRKVTPEFWRVKKRKKIQLQNSGRYIGPDSRRSSWQRLPGRGDDVVPQSGDPWTASPSEARSDLAEGVVDAEGATAPFQRQGPSLQDQSVL
jgi:hypothetical protein